MKHFIQVLVKCLIRIGLAFGIVYLFMALIQRCKPWSG